ncbi:hypothetical protein [Microbacterium caowuchunii]|uniref:Uncharacterized protein n=1 Tax=Microbacterium caowuchunii TaxID=2614638 RepID=A0A5N0T876_9MICO|nr:hypothetical protein [Microbacterium caowuchunii]KAA9131130.1 hypothetical protein F6B40_12555 [Microbacterium caowuchunii]
MSTTELVPRRPIGGIVAVWIVALLAGLTIGIFVSPDARLTWMSIAMGGCLIMAFGVQLAYGRAQRFIHRVALSTLGALLVLGVISAAFGLAALMTAVV